jgi:hypothetical protein
MRATAETRMQRTHTLTPIRTNRNPLTHPHTQTNTRGIHKVAGDVLSHLALQIYSRPERQIKPDKSAWWVGPGLERSPVARFPLLSSRDSSTTATHHHHQATVRLCCTCPVPACGITRIPLHLSADDSTSSQDDWLHTGTPTHACWLGADVSPALAADPRTNWLKRRTFMARYWLHRCVSSP